MRDYYGRRCPVSRKLPQPAPPSPPPWREKRSDAALGPARPGGRRTALGAETAARTIAAAAVVVEPKPPPLTPPCCRPLPAVAVKAPAPSPARGVAGPGLAPPPRPGSPPAAPQPAGRQVSRCTGAWRGPRLRRRAASPGYLTPPARPPGRGEILTQRRLKWQGWRPPLARGPASPRRLRAPLGGRGGLAAAISCRPPRRGGVPLFLA